MIHNEADTVRFIATDIVAYLALKSLKPHS